MATYKNVSGHRIDIPLYDLHVDVDGTFEIPDEVAYSFDGNPDFKSSRTQSPDVTVDPDVVAAAIDSTPIPAPTA